MRRPRLCSASVAKCEDCEQWEPIPFHDKGGVCVSSEYVPVVRPFRERVTLTRAPWYRFKNSAGQSGILPTDRVEGIEAEQSPLTLSVSKDSILKKRIARILSRNPNIDERQISIQVRDSVVQLIGIVGSVIDKRLAEEKARAVPGVKQVINSIRVISAVYKSDVQIMGEILRSLSLCLGLNLSQVSVEVRNGIAFLKGTVRNDRLKSAVDELILSMPFVARLINNLTVSESDHLIYKDKRLQGTS